MFDDDDHGLVPGLEELATFKIVVCTLAVAAKLPFQLGLRRGFFGTIAVDEAGQAFESAIVSVTSLMLDAAKGGQLILCGDPKQLGPVISSDNAKALGLGMSFLERLTAHCELYRRANVQPHPALALTGQGAGDAGGDPRGEASKRAVK